jgi:multidrug transporter EmrE-like cation transporter
MNKAGTPQPPAHSGPSPLACLVLAVVFASLSAGFGKAAAVSMPSFDARSIATNSFYLLSIGCVGLQAAVWPFALRRYPLSVAYMAMSIVYINLLIIAHFIFQEPLTGPNLLGAGLIAFGNVMMARGHDD